MFEKIRNPLFLLLFSLVFFLLSMASAQVLSDEELAKEKAQQKARKEARKNSGKKGINKKGPAELDRDVKLEFSEEEISSVFRDVVVVQRKAKKKAEKFILHTFGSLDFSDGPVTMYGLNVNAGYAFNDFWELYANFVPKFITIERSIVDTVAQVGAEKGLDLVIDSALPQFQAGVDLLWLPAYGKDSWGPFTIVRSDTFFKFSAAMIKYDQGTGLKFEGGVGKTYFIKSWLNVRVTGALAYIETIVENQKSPRFVAVAELGFVFYF